MKSSIIMKKALTICTVAAVAALTFGCSSGKQEENKPKETIALEDTKQELQFFYNSGAALDSTEEATEAEKNQEDTEAEETKQPDDADATEIATEVVTEIVTEYVPVTDAAGEQITEAGGAVQTEVQTEIVTEIATEIVPAASEQNTEAAETDAPAAHTPSYDTCKAYWLDMSQMGDFTFNGEFLVLEFEINEGVPAGSYPITIATTDIGSWDLVTRVPECINGEVTVGDAEAAEQAKATTGAFALKVQNASGNPGDTVKVAIDLENNPGFCGFIIDIQYDAAALTIVDSYGGAEFDAAVNYVQ